ncbi:lamin tail domain-containing protein [Nonomuraea sp. NPDC050310]|uniref:lamin tail domain-containing protein n=1 Tax=Nonomuraea sp. NPDC050310 TaxID=3154935 RepID=UPI0033F7DC09
MAIRALLTTAALLTLAAHPAQAAVAEPLRITKIYYNSPGSPDSGSQASLNGEYVQLKNVSKAKIDLTGWTLHDKTKDDEHVYTFDTFTLKPGRTVTLRTGKGKDTATTLYWGRGGEGTFSYIWNQRSDTAYLRDTTGKLRDSCSYNSRAAFKIC